MISKTTRALFAVGSLAVLGLVAAVVPVTDRPAGAAAIGVVDDFPLADQPRVMDGRVYAIVATGNSVYVGGTFTTIRAAASNATPFTQAYLFKFNVSTGVIDPTFRPVLNGEVEGLALSPDGSRLYVGGAFTTVNGSTRTRLVKLATGDASIDTSFSATATDTVKDLALRGDDLIVGGYFRLINGVSRQRLAAVSATTGALRTGWNVPLAVSRGGFKEYVQDLDVSADGEWLVVVGNFRTAGGLPREQVAVIELDAGTASMANWATNGFDPPCASGFRATYVRGVDIAPDSSWFVVNTTGGHNNATLCDSASRWDLPPRAVGPDVQPTWVSWTGGDTHWAVEVTGEAVYAGGHQRWENSVDPWDDLAPGRVWRPGIAGLDPANGVPLSWNPGRDRGRGVEALLATDSHLFVGSDTVLFADVVRQRLAVLPYAGGTQNPPPEPRQLPIRWHVGMTDGTLRALRYDGAAFGSSSVVSGPAIDGQDWRTVRDGFVQRGQLVYFGPSAAYYRRSYDGTTFGSATNLSTSVGYFGTGNATLYNQPYNVATVTNAGFANGWMYYTRSNDSRLWSRGYSIESGIIGGHEIVASHADWSGPRAIDIVGDWLYAAWDDAKLYRFHLDGRTVQFGTRTLVDDGSASGISWATVGALFSTSATGSGFPPATPVIPNPPTCTGGTPWTAQYFATSSVSGVPVTTRCEAAIAYNYGASGPAGAAVGTDQFAVRWTRRYPLGSTAALVATATGIDDGVRVSVDGVRIIDAWRSAAGNRRGQTTTLAPGIHTIVVDYFESTGNARADVAISEVAPPQGPDVTPPDTTITTPTRNAVVSAGPVTFNGTATDDRGVTSVRVAVRDTVAGLWLQTDGSWATTYAFRLATLSPPSGTSRGWNITIDLATPSSYAIDARASDAGGNFDETPAFVPFRTA